MNYAVVYLPAAEHELATLLLDSSRRTEVTRASHLIDQELRKNPEQLGESRPLGLRIHFSLPLDVLFRVLVEDRRVEVIHVWQYE